MAELKKNSKDLDAVAERIRQLFQDLLRSRVNDKKTVAALAAVLGKTESLVKKMVYKGAGGLDVWVKAFAHIYGLSDSNIKSLKEHLRREQPISESDKIWFSLKDDLGASEEHCLYLAECAKAAFLIRKDIDAAKKRRQTKT